MASRLGLLVDFLPGGSGSPTDFLSFGTPPCVQLGRRDDLRGDVGGRLVAGASGVLMGSDHAAVHADRPVQPFGEVGVAAQLLEDPGQRAVA